MIRGLQKFVFTLLCAVPLAFGATHHAAAQSNSEAITLEWSPYVAPKPLAAFRHANLDIQVIDIRSEKYLKKGAIEGAVWMPHLQFHGTSARSGQPPTEAELSSMLAEAGISLDQPIVVYNHANKTFQNGRAATVYWLLKTAGADQLAILNGGFKAWQAEDLPIAEVPTIRSAIAPAEITYTHEHWADPMDIFAVTTGQKDGSILDARLDSQVRKSVETGEPMMSMPLAQYIPSSFFMNYLSSSQLEAPAKEEFRADLVNRGVNVGDGMLISVCQTGELSALSWFYASEIVGIDNVRYYPDALRGWKNDGGLMFGMPAAL